MPGRSDDKPSSWLTDSDYGGKPERAFVFQVQAWDVNCPQHIKPRWTDEELSPIIDELRARVDQLEAENARLRVQSGRPGQN